jgi:hypothetical protein
MGVPSGLCSTSAMIYECAGRVIFVISFRCSWEALRNSLNLIMAG